MRAGRETDAGEEGGEGQKGGGGAPLGRVTRNTLGLDSCVCFFFWFLHSCLAPVHSHTLIYDLTSHSSEDGSL